MGMVVMQIYIFGVEAIETKTEFLRCTGYLISLKKTINQDVLLILVLV